MDYEKSFKWRQKVINGGTLLDETKLISFLKMEGKYYLTMMENLYFNNLVSGGRGADSYS